MDRFGRLYAQSKLATFCVLEDGYIPPGTFSEIISLTVQGEELRDKILDGPAEGNLASATLAILGRWAGQSGLYIETEQTDPDRLRECLSAEIKASRIRYPWVFGRALHDRYVRDFGQNTCELTHEQSIEMLRDTGQGVIQQGNYVSGPLGLMESQSTRTMDLAGVGVILRCEDPVCSALHVVGMKTGTTLAGAAYSAAGRHDGPATAPIQRESNRSLYSNETFYDPGGTNDLPWLLGNGLTEGELRLVLESLLSDRGVELRSLVNKIIPTAKKQSAIALASGLEPAAVLQLILVADTHHIVSALERLVGEAKIELDETEKRTALIRSGRVRGAFTPVAELSRLGVRFTGALSPTERLGIMIEAVFADMDDDLSWRLRGHQGADPREKLVTALRAGDPRVLLRETAFASRESLNRAFEIAGPGDYALPDSSESEERLIDKILWKAGFDQPAPPRPDGHLLAACEDFLGASNSNQHDAEARVRTTRGAGNEMYVRLEELLSLVVEYSTWALLSDHFAIDRHERFTFTRRLAHDRASAILTPLSDESFEWRLDGKNSLGTLIATLWRIGEIVRNIDGDDPNTLRPVDQLPSFAVEAPQFHFPFRHVSLSGDLTSSSRQRLSDALQGASVRLANSAVVDVRNRLDHNRPGEFPETAEVDSAVRTIRDVVDSISREGLIPVVYAFKLRSVDNQGRSTVTYVDGDGAAIEVPDPDQYSTPALPQPREAQLIFGGAILSSTFQCVRFRLRPDNEWSKYWRGVDAAASHQETKPSADVDMQAD